MNHVLNLILCIEQETSGAVRYLTRLWKRHFLRSEILDSYRDFAQAIETRPYYLYFAIRLLS